MSEEEVMWRLRAEPVTRAIPVVVMSADASPRRIERLLADGAAHYLTTPLDVHRFLTVLDTLLRDGED